MAFTMAATKANIVVKSLIPNAPLKIEPFVVIKIYAIAIKNNTKAIRLKQKKK